MNATASSGWCGKPSSRHSSCAISSGTPARSHTSTWVRLGAEPSRYRSTVSSASDRSGWFSSVTSGLWREPLRSGLLQRRVEGRHLDVQPVQRSLVKWISSNGVSATIVAVRSEWFRIAASPTMSPAPSRATSVPWLRTDTVPLRMM